MSHERAEVDFLGDAAISARFAGDDLLAVNARVHALAAAVHAASLPGVLDVVPGMRELVVHIAPLTADLPDLMQVLTSPPNGQCGVRPEAAFIEVPVHYGGDAGPDLHDVASRCGLHVDDVCARHSALIYTVCFVGFLPGFP